jgi:hypothetical protein
MISRLLLLIATGLLVALGNAAAIESVVRTVEVLP